VDTNKVVFEKYSFPLSIKLSREELRLVASIELELSAGQQAAIERITCPSNFNDLNSDLLSLELSVSPSSVATDSVTSVTWGTWGNKTVSVGDTTDEVFVEMGAPDTIYAQKMSLGPGKHWIYRSEIPSSGPDEKLVVTYGPDGKLVSRVRVLRVL
jgi:hypothetical protein